MNVEEMFRVTGTSTVAAGAPVWPHLDGTGSLVQVPEMECDLTSLKLQAHPEAEILVRSIQAGLGLTIGQIARALGKTRQAVHGWKRGESLEDANLANLRELARWSDEWTKGWPSRQPDSTSWTDAFLKSVAEASAFSQAGRSLWATFLAEQSGIAARRSKIPSVEEIDRQLGSAPSTGLQKAQRLADNIRSMRRDARRGA
ncbi:MAG TPA: hypothetical protein PKY05_10780 [Fibrobacteria bacterium]|nr:hypothetical protein [Fibrobacteria bacterium]